MSQAPSGPASPGSRDELVGAAERRPALPAGVAGRYRELTLGSLLLGVAIGLVMNASITYAGLKIGFTIVGSAIAAVLGFGVLKLFRRGTIVETNVLQTVASAVNTSNSGIIFTFPVLFLLGFSMTWEDVDFWRIALAAVAGGVLGTAFIIPLRKQMIDIERLRFPTGTGVASVLKSPGAGPRKAAVLIAGVVIAAVLYAPVELPKIVGPVGGADRAALAANLDALIERGRASEADKATTLAIHDQIESRRADPEELARGRLVHDLTTARAEAETARRVRADAHLAFDRVRRQVGDAPEAQTMRERADAALADLTAKRAVVRGLRERLGLEPDAPISKADRRAERVYLIAGDGPEPEGGRPAWESLRAVRFGWAPRGLWGYQDLNLRLPEYFTRDGRMIANLDRDADARPDLFLTDGSFDLGRLIGLPGQFQLVFALTPLALGAGFITGRAGLLVLAGGLLAYFVINPTAYNLGWTPASMAAHEAPGFMFGSVNRPLGIGLLLGGAMMGVVFALPSIFAALRSMAGPRARAGGRSELGLGVLIPVIVAGAGMLFVAADFVGSSAINPKCPITEPAGEADVLSSVQPAEHRGYTIGFASDEASAAWTTSWTDAQKDAYLETLSAKPGLLAGMNRHARAAIIAAVGVLWIWFAGIIIAQCTGLTDWSPISGLALLTVVMVMLLAGTGAVVGAVMLGAALCVAITLAADMMADLRTGYNVGAKPAAQQAAELAVVWIGPAVSMLTVLLIVAVNMKTTGVPLGPGTETPAPQADALQAVIRGVQGGDIPYWLYGLGASLGVVLGLGGFPGLGVLVGLSVYLPFIYIATYGVGCVLSMFLSAVKGKRFVEEWGVPMAAGLIVGEGVLALVINIVVLTQG